MLDTGNLRQLLAKSDKIKSQHRVIAEWNMNRYQKIVNFGLYLGSNLGGVYDANASNIVEGNNFIIYDDQYAEESVRDNKFSSLGSVFLPDRPDSGIVLLQNLSRGLIEEEAFSLSTIAMSSGSARFYPFMENRPYDYFNSAKNLTASTSNRNTSGVSSVIDGTIQSANPFVVYDEAFPVNKILIKVQNHVSFPTEFYIDVIKRTNTSSWVNVFYSSDATAFSSGSLAIYYDNGSWSLTTAYVNTIENIYNVSGSETDVILGIRLRVKKMKVPVDSSGNRYRTGLELIEISPRIEAELTSYTESFSFNSSLGESEFGLPLGKLVVGTGNITLSNDTLAFISSSALQKFEMLRPNVEFRFYQNIDVSESGGSGPDEYLVPIRTMYADQWNTNGDYITNISLSDRFRLFQEKSVVDMAFITKDGIPFSVAILSVLDNCGVTGYEFKKTSNNAQSDSGEDTRITNFFCNKDQTLMEVLEKIAVATQSCMFIDSSNKLNVLTKERVAQIRETSHSSSVLGTTGTDFWFVGDEDTTDTGAPSYVSSSYVSNIVSLEEAKMSPITDGDINYKTYGLRKIPGAANLLQERIPSQYLDDVPALSVGIGSGFSYSTTKLWSPGSDNSGVLGAANLLETMNAYRLKDIYKNPIVASSEQDAIRAMYTTASTSSARGAIIIQLDRNEIYTIPDYEGYVFVDGEYIEYYGKAFIARNSSGTESRKIFFSNEDLSQHISRFERRSSIVPIGLIVKPEFSVTRTASTNKYSYTVIDDGRGAFDSKVSGHARVRDKADSDIVDSKRFTVEIGGKRNDNMSASPKLSTTNKYNFAEIRGFNRLRNQFNIPNQNYQTYLGHLKIAGPRGLQRDRATFSSASINAQLQNINNTKVDDIVPGSGSLSFDDFVYFLGERYIHAQKIDLQFPPNIISTRMRLYSGKRNLNDRTSIASTISSIAGIGFDTKSDGSGYYLEVESIGSGKDSVSPRSVNRNLRFYKTFYRAGRLNVEILFTGAVNVQAVVNRDIELTTDKTVPTDPVFEISIVINRARGAAEYDIYYGDNKMNKTPIVDVTYDSKGKKMIDKNRTIEKNIVLFVRNDSQAIYEYVAAVGTPWEFRPSTMFNFKPDYGNFDTMINKGLTGLIPVNGANLIVRDGQPRKIYYFNDFAKIVRQAKKYDIRYENGPAIYAKLIDISRVNPKYAIKSQKYTPYGAEIVVVNTSAGAIAISEDTNLPLYISGIVLEELSNGSVSMESLFEKNINYKKKAVDMAFNKASFGDKTFSLDSEFIQSRDMAIRLMRWISRYCNRERMQITAEIFPNPILELGDKVKVLAKDRGYFQNNEAYKNKTFVISEIDYSVSKDGPSMTVKLIEVGE